MRSASISADGLLVVKREKPFWSSSEIIVIPRTVSNGLVAAIHIKLHHPTAGQLKKLFNRYFFSFSSDTVIETFTENCFTCKSLKKIPRESVAQTSTPVERPGLSFAADVMRRERQMIFVLRDCFSSMTYASIIFDEKMSSLRNALLIAASALRLSSEITVRVDNSTSFQGLFKDSILSSHGIRLVVGRVFNPNKNPIAERAVQELENQFLRHGFSGRQFDFCRFGFICRSFEFQTALS